MNEKGKKQKNKITINFYVKPAEFSCISLQFEMNLYFLFSNQAKPDKITVAVVNRIPRSFQCWFESFKTLIIRIVCSSRSFILLEFSITKFDNLHFSSKDICAAIRFLASLSESLKRSIKRLNWMSSSLQWKFLNERKLLVSIKSFSGYCVDSKDQLWLFVWL